MWLVERTCVNIIFLYIFFFGLLLFLPIQNRIFHFDEVNFGCFLIHFCFRNSKSERISFNYMISMKKKEKSQTVWPIVNEMIWKYLPIQWTEVSVWICVSSVQLVKIKPSSISPPVKATICSSTIRCWSDLFGLLFAAEKKFTFTQSMLFMFSSKKKNNELKITVIDRIARRVVVKFLYCVCAIIIDSRCG